MRTKALFLTLLGVLTIFGPPALALPPIATVTSSAPFTVDGHTLGTASIFIGNEVATSTAPATLLFPDGSSVILARSSHAKLTGSAGRPKLILLGGALDYKVVLGSNLSVTNLDLERQTQPTAKSVPHPAKPVPTPRPDQVTLTVL